MNKTILTFSTFVHQAAQMMETPNSLFCDITAGTEIEMEFLSSFKTARITGEVEYLTNSVGAETTIVPFWFNHPGGESCSNENMNLVKIDGKWFLASF